MKIVAIKQTASGHNIHFISDEYSEYTLDDLLAQGDKVALENVQVFKPKSGKESVRLKADKDKFNNLENLAITCNEGDYLFFDRHYLHLKARNGRTKKSGRPFLAIHRVRLQINPRRATARCQKMNIKFILLRL